MTPLDIAHTAAKALDDKKGGDIKILKIKDLTVLADYFVIATGTSTTQVKALAGEIEHQMEQKDIALRHREGYDSGGWVLLDYNSVIVHIFQPSTREFYALERLWADAEPVETAYTEPRQTT